MLSKHLCPPLLPPAFNFSQDQGTFGSSICFPGGSDGKESACNEGDPGLIPGSGRSLEKERVTHCSILAWRIPWTEDSGRLQSVGLQRVGPTPSKPRPESMFPEQTHPKLSVRSPPIAHLTAWDLHPVCPVNPGCSYRGLPQLPGDETIFVIPQNSYDAQDSALRMEALQFIFVEMRENVSWYREKKPTPQGF